uniref:Major facilitator superfamily (MFS) profile domain-containing protein n=1 Tax=Ciona savignyi TaxID=51511 RepID=H2Y7Q4_CIOSA
TQHFIIQETWNRYPKHIFFIVGNEFCERFSYYGMRSVLLLYLRDYLHWDDDTSTSVYHAFTVLAYLFPLLGAIVADSYWGKYKTIIYLSIVYVFGHIVKTIGSIPYVPIFNQRMFLHSSVLSMFGLFFIAVGTGGIKPCVSSFGGDQFKPGQSYIRKQFFSLFYFAINAGSLISTFVTPIFRADVDCYPNETAPEFDQCFALAFGVPGALMVVALILFIAGTRWYTIYPPEGSIITKFCMCIYTACRNRWNTPKQERNKEHWLEYADSPPKLIRDTKYVLRVLVLYIPLPFFWALFDQQGSRWTLQAIQTNGYLGSLLIKPDQVEVLNPLLIVTLIPLFEATLYPFLRYFNIPFPPLRRMTVGLILAGCSFIAAAILQIEIDNLDLNPNTVNVAWMIPQFLIITVGEVFLSVTGLEFSYTQAPPSMKSVLTSIWLFTVSLGNIIVLIIAEAKGIEKQSDEFFLFAGLIFVAALLFIFLAYRW